MASTWRKTPEPVRLLLDADVVIEAHRLGVWDKLIARARVACPATVVTDEALFYRQDEFSVTPRIHLPKLVEEGKLAMLEASADDLAQVVSILTQNVLGGLHPGETEALALLGSGKAQGWLFCTGDRAAIHALALLGLSEKGISFERALSAVGLTKRLPRQFTDSYFQRSLREGQERRLRGLGLRDAARKPPT